MLLVLALISCKNEPKKDVETVSQTEELSLLKGQFVYYGDAAVLQTRDEIYGVLVTDKMLELDKMAKAYKADPTDMVLVEIKGKITDKEHDVILWKNKVEVVEILNVSALNRAENDVVKLAK